MLPVPNAKPTPRTHFRSPPRVLFTFSGGISSHLGSASCRCGVESWPPRLDDRPALHAIAMLRLPPWSNSYSVLIVPGVSATLFFFRLDPDIAVKLQQTFLKI